MSLLNGVQVSPYPSVESINEARALGAKLFRVQILSTASPGLWEADCHAQVDSFLTNVYPNLLPGSKYIIDLHNTPNARILDPEVIEMVSEFWRVTVAKLRPFNHIFYGVLNEPKGNVTQVNSLNQHCVATIRATEKYLYVGPKVICVSTPYGNCTMINKLLRFPTDKRIWYEVHFYSPAGFTHQRVPGFPQELVRLNASTISRMKRDLANCYNFRKSNPNLPLFIGEFGCVDFAEDADRAKWFSTCYSHWKALKANTCVHAWREWEHWQPSGKTLAVVKANLS